MAKATGPLLALALALAGGAIAPLEGHAAAPMPSGVVWSATQIARHGTLTAGQTVSLTATAMDSLNLPLPGIAVTIYFFARSPIGAGAVAGMATVVGGTVVNPWTFIATTDAQGKVQIRYAAGNLDAGCDTFRMEGSWSNAQYCYEVGARYFWDNTPKASAAYAFLAPSGSLAAGQVVNTAVHVVDDAGRPVAGAPVWINARGTSGSSVMVYGLVGMSLYDTKHLNREFFTDSAGQVAVTYVTAPTLPDQSAADDIRASSANDVWVQPDSYHAMTAYRFERVDSYRFSIGAIGFELPSAAIALGGSLPAAARVRIVVEARNSSVLAAGGSVCYSLIWVSFSQSAGGGRASVKGQLLGASPQGFLTDTLGRLTIYYDAPKILPAPGGTDTLVVQDGAGTATVNATIGYVF